MGGRKGERVAREMEAQHLMTMVGESKSGLHTKQSLCSMYVAPFFALNLIANGKGVKICDHKKINTSTVQLSFFAHTGVARPAYK